MNLPKHILNTKICKYNPPKNASRCGGAIILLLFFRKSMVQCPCIVAADDFVDCNFFFSFLVSMVVRTPNKNIIWTYMNRVRVRQLVRDAQYCCQILLHQTIWFAMKLLWPLVSYGTLRPNSLRGTSFGCLQCVRGARGTSPSFTPTSEPPIFTIFGFAQGVTVRNHKEVMVLCQWVKKFNKLL